MVFIKAAELRALYNKRPLCKLKSQDIRRQHFITRRVKLVFDLDKATKILTFFTLSKGITKKHVLTEDVRGQF